MMIWTGFHGELSLIFENISRFWFVSPQFSMIKIGLSARRIPPSPLVRDYPLFVNPLHSLWTLFVNDHLLNYGLATIMKFSSFGQNHGGEYVIIRDNLISLS